MARIVAISSSVYRRCPLRSFCGWISPRCSSRFKVVGLIPTWWAASLMRIRRLLMPVYPDLSGSFTAIPDHMPPAVVRPQRDCGTAPRLLLAQSRVWVKQQRPHAYLCWGAGEPQAVLPHARGWTGVRGVAPEAIPLPGLLQTPRAASLAQQVDRLQRGSCIVLCGSPVDSFWLFHV